ncbi:MAG: hypothetical protein H6633_19420 [Anaerolineales bacterium]|nr:hypothetical protein [Anaerolineales bacterium]
MMNDEGEAYRNRMMKVKKINGSRRAKEREAEAIALREQRTLKRPQLAQS